MLEGCAKALFLVGDGTGWAAAHKQRAEESGGLAVHARCSYQADGPFAGISRLILALAQVAQANGHGGLITAHDASLTALSPALARLHPPRYPMLTLAAEAGEGVRLLSSEWTTRYVNGMIDFLLALQDRLGKVDLAIGLLDWDQAGPIAEEFLVQLARRGRNRPLLVWASGAAPTPAWERLTRYLPGEVLAMQPDGHRPEQPGGHRPEQPGPPVPELPGGPWPLPEPAGPDEAALAYEICLLLAGGERKAAFERLDRAVALFLRWGFTADALRYCRWWAEEAGEEPQVALLNRLATALTTSGQPEEAEGVIRQALALSLSPRTRAGFLYALAMLHTRFHAQQNLTQAHQLMEQSLQALGEQPAPDARAFYRNGLALVLLRQGKPAEALRVCEEALALLEQGSTPEQYRLQKMVLVHNIGRIFVAMGRLEEALPYFARVQASDPFYPELYQERGGLYMRLGRPAEALADFAQGVEYGPPSTQLYACCGNAVMALGQPDGAVTYFERALELDEEFAYGYKGRALCLYDLGRLSEALADYDAYLARRPSDLDALCNRGSLRHDLGDLQGALADLDRVLEQQPENVAALANRVAVLTDLGRYQEAIDGIDLALELDPGNEVIRQNREYLLNLVKG